MPNSHVRRRIKSCALCRRRKIKCDANSQPCAQCEKVGAKCVGLDPVTHQTTPRSLVQWLENEIALITRPLGQDYQLTGRAEPFQRLENPTDEEANDGISGCKTKSTTRDPVMTRLVDQVFRDTTFSCIGFSQDFALPNFVMFSGVQVPSTERQPGTPSDASGTAGSVLQQAQADDPLASIPVRVADFLMENYISRSFPSYPFFYEPWLRWCHAEVFHRYKPDRYWASLVGSYEKYTMSLVMAVSLSTAARTNQAQANAVSFRLFNYAYQHISSVLTNDIAGLQALLLLCQYVIMMPTASNIYYLTGYVMQTCIELGLHDEKSEFSVDDYLARDIKRRIFWTAWEMDVSCAASLSRPIMLLPRQITTGHPSIIEDRGISPEGISLNGRPTKFLCARIREFRLMEVEILSILFHEEPLPAGLSSLDHWMEDVGSRIHSWSKDIYNKAADNQDQELVAQWSEMTLFAEIADPLLVVALFRPCPLIKAPTTANLMKAFTAAIKVAEGYFKQANTEFGSPKYTFLPCYHVFSSAMVFLHALRQCKSSIASAFSLEEIDGFASVFLQFFSLTAERWPAASSCLKEFQRLLEPVRETYNGYGLQHDQMSPASAMDVSTNLNSAFEPERPSTDTINYGDVFFESIDLAIANNLTDLSTDFGFDWDTGFNFDMEY